METIEKIRQAKSWEERYRLIIQVGKNIAEPDEQSLAQWDEISGCESKLWVKITQNSDRTLALQAYSQARIMNGLLWLLMQEVNGKTPEELRSFQINEFFTALGIAQRLSATRLNGLGQIGERIKNLV